MNSKCKNLTCSSLQVSIGSERKVPPEMVLTTIFVWLLINLTSPSLHPSLCEISFFPPSRNNFCAQRSYVTSLIGSTNKRVDKRSTFASLSPSEFVNKLKVALLFFSSNLC